MWPNGFGRKGWRVYVHVPEQSGHDGCGVHGAKEKEPRGGGIRIGGSGTRRGRRLCDKKFRSSPAFFRTEFFFPRARELSFFCFVGVPLLLYLAEFQGRLRFLCTGGRRKMNDSEREKARSFLFSLWHIYTAFFCARLWMKARVRCTIYFLRTELFLRI